MDFVNDLILIIAVALVIVIVGWMELRYLKRRRKDRVDVGIIKDEAYSAVATTKAVASSLEANGRDILEAETIIYRAESAYERGDYIACKDLADQARNALLRSKSKELVDPPEPPAPTKKEKLTVEVLSVSAKKMPANYLESKFIIETVDSMVQAAGEDARAAAEPHVQEAEKAFEKGDYTAALCSSMRAKRMLEGTPAKAEKKAPARSEVIALPEREKEEADVPPKCPLCGAAVGPEDEFCFACGNRQGPKTCPSCSNEVAEDDAFCRKCGTKLET